MRTRVKLCEFESLDAAYAACQLGADALGFHIFKHHDLNERLSLFKGIFKFLPAQVSKVLLTDIDFEALVEVSKTIKLDAIQLYPDWENKEILRLRKEVANPVQILKVMSAVPEENRITDSIGFVEYYKETVDAILLDSFRRGGTGQIADWAHCAEIVKRSPLPVYLAGGLTVENVGIAIRQIAPYGVDVETGVSDRIPNGPLVKNISKCHAFIEAVRAADAGVERRAMP